MFVLDPKNYENSALNTAELIRWMAEAMSQLNYYRGAIHGEKAE